jgi:hypothetical protein
MGGQGTRAVTVAVAETLLGSLMAVSIQKGGELQLNQLLQAMARELWDLLPSAAAIQ